MPLPPCVICGEQAERVYRGWPFCSDERPMLRASKFPNRCSDCGGDIAVGDMIILVRAADDSVWLLFHDNAECREGPAIIRGGNGSHAVLHLLPSAPAEVIKAAYRAMSLIHHPDRGGSTEAMARINDAMDKLMGKR